MEKLFDTLVPPQACGLCVIGVTDLLSDVLKQCATRRELDILHNVSLASWH